MTCEHDEFSTVMELRIKIKDNLNDIQHEHKHILSMMDQVFQSTCDGVHETVFP
jgi:hypothetical protein